MLRWPRRIRLFGTLTLLVAGWLATPAIQAAEAPDPAAKLDRIFAGDAPQTVDDLKAMQGHLQKLAEQLIPWTVGVRVGQAQGSGVIITKDGYVLTAAHVVGTPNTEVTFILPDGKTAKGKTLGVNRTLDAGLMKITDESQKIIEKPEWPHAEMGMSSELKDGQWCVATGHPGGYEKGRTPVVRFGRVLQHADSVIMTDCTLVGGDSGGPLFDMQGRVIGINSRIAGPLNANMHVPVNTFRDTWDRLAKAEAWGSMAGNAPFLGVKPAENGEGLKIDIIEKSPAANSGLKAGDLILGFDGKDVDTFANLASMVGDKAPGDKVKVKLKRGEETLEIEVTLGKKEN